MAAGLSDRSDRDQVLGAARRSWSLLWQPKPKRAYRVVGRSSLSPWRSSCCRSPSARCATWPLRAGRAARGGAAAGPRFSPAREGRNAHRARTAHALNLRSSACSSCRYRRRRHGLGRRRHPRLGWRPLRRGALAARAPAPARSYNRYDDGGFLIWFAPDAGVHRQPPGPLPAALPARGDPGRAGAPTRNCSRAGRFAAHFCRSTRRSTSNCGTRAGGPFISTTSLW